MPQVNPDQSIQSEIHARAFTSIDKQLLGLSVNREIEISRYGSPAEVRVNQSALVGRLMVLEKMKLAEKRTTYVWKLAPNFKPKLDYMQRCTEAVKHLQRVDQSLSAPARERLVLNQQFDRNVEGIVFDKGMHDEASDLGYLIVGDISGRLLYMEVKGVDKLESVQEQSIISVRYDNNLTKTKIDQNISEYAMRKKGLFNEKEYSRWSVSLKKVTHVRLVNYMKMYSQRLRSLQQSGLVQKIGDNWQIPNDLLRQLDRQAGKAETVINKCHQLTLKEQVHYWGRTYLDEQYDVIAQSDHSDGVSRIYQSAVTQRKLWLEKKGLKAGERVACNVLDLVEMKKLAESVARKSGLAFKALTEGESLKGQCIGTISTQSLDRYVVVADEAQFTLVRWVPTKTPEKGKTMMVGIKDKSVYFQ